MQLNLLYMHAMQYYHIMHVHKGEGRERDSLGVYINNFRHKCLRISLTANQLDSLADRQRSWSAMQYSLSVYLAAQLLAA